MNALEQYAEIIRDMGTWKNASFREKLVEVLHWVSLAGGVCGFIALGLEVLR